MGAEESPLESRVAHAYYNYGRFCSSHPISCLLTSIFTTLLLASPLARVSLVSSSPLDIYWSDNVSEALSAPNLPDWLQLPPRTLIQQIMIRARVQPWDPRRLEVDKALKGPLSRAFAVHDIVRDFGASSLDETCFMSRAESNTPLLPAHGCLILSPSLFWDNQIENFYRENDVLKRIFAPSCTTTMCARDLLFGLQTSSTGVKLKYRTNRQRTIQFAITTVLKTHDKTHWDAVIRKIQSLPGFSLVDGEKKFVHIFYKSSKSYVERFPLVISYALLLLYLYFSISKIRLVKSKWGLAISQVVTVASSLISAAGICHYFELTPTLWGAEWFPYLAMVLGLENTVCITRSVVLTNVHWDVRSRIAYGLSREGYSITKNFLAEILIVTAGFFTFVPEIQEFCAFSFIGLVVDFYMQLFFYAPCLTFDMLRMASDPELKNRIELLLLASSLQNQTKKNYPPVLCPIAMLFPSIFPREENQETASRLYRVKSESGINEKPAKVGHKRAASNTTADVAIPLSEPRHVVRVNFSKRLKLIRFLARTRFFNRFFMIMTVLWIVWLVVIVHQMNALVDPIKQSPSKSEVGSGEFSGPTQPLEWGNWQRKTFKWWPALLDNYNVTLSGRYITMLPPVIFDVSIPPDDPAITFSGSDEPLTPVKTSSDKSESSLMPPELRLRISWLELQMSIVLIVSVGIFAVVAAFILYVCFSGKGSYGHLDEDIRPSSFRKQHRRLGSKAIVDTMPIVFTGHHRPVECIATLGDDKIVSACLGGEVRIWDARTGECLKVLPRKPTPLNGLSQEPTMEASPEAPGLRRRVVPTIRQYTQPLASVAPNAFGPQHRSDSFLFETDPTPSIWSLTVLSNLVALGCSNGSVELWDALSGTLMGKFENSDLGVTRITIKGKRLFLSRINGILELVDLVIDPQRSSPRIAGHSFKLIRAHQLQITCIGVSQNLVITGSMDRSLKLFHNRTGELIQTLYGHNAAVKSIQVDDAENILFSCCADGLINSWDLSTGRFLRTFQTFSSDISIAITSSLLLAYRQDGHFWIWDKESGRLETSLMLQETKDEDNLPAIPRSSSLISLGDYMAVSMSQDQLQLWDLQRKAKLRDVKLPGSENISALLLLNSESLSVVCAKGKTIFRVNFPIIKIK